MNSYFQHSYLQLWHYLFSHSRILVSMWCWSDYHWMIGTRWMQVRVATLGLPKWITCCRETTSSAAIAIVWGAHDLCGWHIVGGRGNSCGCCSGRDGTITLAPKASRRYCHCEFFSCLSSVCPLWKGKHLLFSLLSLARGGTGDGGNCDAAAFFLVSFKNFLSPPPCRWVGLVSLNPMGERRGGGCRPRRYRHQVK